MRTINVLFEVDQKQNSSQALLIYVKKYYDDNLTKLTLIGSVNIFN
jgi:hypothetical protein